MDNKLYRIEVIAHNNLPTIDTAGMLMTNEGIAYVKLHPVKLTAKPKCDNSHGRWERDGTCSNCKGLNPTYRENKWSAEFPDFPGHFDHLNYCSNCGARMDGDN